MSRPNYRLQLSSGWFGCVFYDCIYSGHFYRTSTECGHQSCPENTFSGQVPLTPYKITVTVTWICQILLDRTISTWPVYLLYICIFFFHFVPRLTEMYSKIDDSQPENTIDFIVLEQEGQCKKETVSNIFSVSNIILFLSIYLQEEGYWILERVGWSMQDLLDTNMGCGQRISCGATSPLGSSLCNLHYALRALRSAPPA